MATGFAPRDVAALTERLAAEPMLAQVERWALVNSGTRNLAGLATMAALLADAFAALPGDVALHDAAPVDAVAADGSVCAIDHGQHLLATVRPDAPLQLLFTGHMDTVFGADHCFQALDWRAPGVLNGPGVADMKGGIALMLAALKAVEASPLAPRIGYQVLLNSDEETGSLSSAALIASAAHGEFFHHRARHQRPCRPQPAGRPQRNRCGGCHCAGAERCPLAHPVGKSRAHRRRRAK